MARIITITSGKGGVGKTSISLNLSLSLASKGHKVCLFDADLGLANVNILTGIYPEKDLVHVISGKADLKDIMVKDFQGIDIIPGSTGVERLADLTVEETRGLINAFLSLDDYDYFIFDTSAGISSQVLSFCMASHEIILVVTCEPTSMTDAYSMLKSFSKHGYANPVKILINRVKTGKAAKKTYTQLKETVKRFLTVTLEPLGIVGQDNSVEMAVVSQTPFIMLFPNTLASKCIRTITDKLINKSGEAADLPLEIFWDNCLAFFEKHHDAKKEGPALESGNQPGGAEQNETPAETDTGASLDKPVSESALYKALDQKIDSIDERLSILTGQVGQILQLLEDRKTEQKKATAPAPPPLPKSGKITLDFESWLKENKKLSS